MREVACCAASCLSAGNAWCQGYLPKAPASLCRHAIILFSRNCMPQHCASPRSHFVSSIRLGSLQRCIDVVVLLCRWAPNAASLVHASAMCGASWQALPQPEVGSGASTTFDSQPTFVFPYTCASGSTVLLYMGDRWNVKGPGSVRPAITDKMHCECGWPCRMASSKCDGISNSCRYQRRHLALLPCHLKVLNAVRVPCVPSHPARFLLLSTVAKVPCCCEVLSLRVTPVRHTATHACGGRLGLRSPVYLRLCDQLCGLRSLPTLAMFGFRCCLRGSTRRKATKSQICPAGVSATTATCQAPSCTFAQM